MRLDELEIDEASPLELLKRKISPALHMGQYEKATDLMYKVIKRKEAETNGKLRHGLGYYAMEIGRQFKNIDYRALAKYFIDKYPDDAKKLFNESELMELKIVKPDPKDTMGIKRAEMPQIATKDYPEFIDYLKDNGAHFTKDTVSPDSLKAIQGEFSDQGIEKALMKQHIKKPSIVSSDNYIIDGHHRWLAAMNTGQSVDIFRVDKPGKELLQLVKDFPKTTYKDIYNEADEINGSLVDKFLKATGGKYGKRDMCGPACLDFIDWAKQQGIELKRVRGEFVADEVVSAKADFTPEMKKEFMQSGLDWNSAADRKAWIEQSKYAEEWKRVPHYWTVDKDGNIHDPSGYQQLVKTGLAKDLDPSRYIPEVVNEADEVIPMLYHATYKPFLDSIMKNGLGGKGAQTQWEDSKPGYVYLAKDPEVAVSHAEANEEVPDEYVDNIVVLSIDTSQLDQDNLEDDPNVIDDDSTLAYKGIIPTSAFSVNESSSKDTYNEKENIVRQSDIWKVVNTLADRRDDNPFPVRFYDGGYMKVKPSTAKRIVDMYYRATDSLRDKMMKIIHTYNGFKEIAQAAGAVQESAGVGKITKQNTTPDVKPGETERQAKKFFGGNGKPKPLGVKGATPNQAFNLGLTEGYKLQLERGDDMDVLHITDTKTGKRTEVRGKPDYERAYDPTDKLHQLLDKIGKASNISDLINGEVVGINPKHPDGASAKKAADVAYNENMSVTGTARGKEAKRKKLVPGSEAWFKHWFSLPLLKREHVEMAKAELVEYVRLIRENDGKDYMHGYCHVWALKDIQKHPERKIFARVGYHYDDGSEEVDHIFTVDSETGKAYDVRGEFNSIDALLADYEYGADEVNVQEITRADIDDLCRSGELKPLDENFKDGKVKGKSRPGRVKAAGASCNGSVTELRRKAKKYSGERGKMYHWCANMKSGKKKG